ncbi:MAG: DUF1194 domain-containing protein [Gemmobacter sp.]
MIRLAVMLLAILAAAPARAGCRLALVLALDVSASVDATEYDLQATGMARALLSAPVAEVLLDNPARPAALAVFVWSGPGDVALVADWTLIDGAGTLRSLADRIARHPRKTSFDGRTAIGSALAQGGFLHATAPACDRRVIDIAADGENNAGPAPEGPRDALTGITVNALAITGERPHDQARNDRPQRSLARYLERHVIRGPDAFVETALDYADFERAMTRKLLRELRPLMIGSGVGELHRPWLYQR